MKVSNFAKLLILSVVFACLPSLGAFASGSWTSGVFTEEARVEVDSKQPCDYRNVQIGNTNYSGTFQVCVYERDGWRYGSYQTREWISQTVTVVGFGLDKKMYEVENLSIDGLLNTPHTDDFIYRKLTVPHVRHGYTLQKITNLPSHLQKISKNGLIKYRLFGEFNELLQPVVVDKNGQMPTTGATNVSSDGRRIVVELINKGLMTYNTITGEFRYVTNYAYDYQLYNETSFSLDVSPSGRVITTFNHRKGWKIFTIQDQCGIKAESYVDIESQLGVAKSCPDDNGRMNDLMRQLHGNDTAAWWMGSRVGYNDDAIYLRTQEPIDDNWMTFIDFETPIRSGDYEPTQTLDYLALGDSYSSGEGDIEKDRYGASYYTPETIGDGGCHLSTRSYPYLLRSYYEIADNKMKSVACSGATLFYDYNLIKGTYLGQGGRLKELSEADRNQAQADALDKFTPGVVPQIEFVKKYQPKAITLTGGGNDVDFAEILTYCATPEIGAVIVADTCGYAKEDSDLNKLLYASIDTQYTYNKRFINAIREASPKTNIIIIGYPSFISSEGTCVLNSADLEKVEIIMINKAVTYMNEMLKKVASDTGTSYVDVEDSLKSGRLCEGSEYVTGLVDLGYEKLRKKQFSEAFHPNHKGHQKMFESISSSIPKLTTFYNSTSSDWSPRSLHIVAFQASLIKQVMALGDKINIAIEAGRFAGRSSITINAYSEQSLLGSFVTSQDGSLNAEIDTSSILPGRHLIVVRGSDMFGQEMLMYQYFTVAASLDDIDGDKIPNDQDRCEFIQSWIDEQTNTDVCLTPAEKTNTVDTNKPGEKLADVDVSSISQPKFANQLMGRTEHNANNQVAAPPIRVSHLASLATAKLLHKIVSAEISWHLIVVLILMTAAFTKIVIKVLK